MSWSTLRDVLEAMSRSGQERVELSFIGGEPLLEIDAIQRAVQWVESRSAAAPRFTYSVITNGLLLSEPMIDFFVRHRFDLRLSHDGVAAAQDQRRRGSAAALDRLLGALLREHRDYCRRHLTVNMTLTPVNLPVLADSVSRFIDMGAPDISVAPDLCDRPDWRLRDIEVLDQQVGRVYDASLRHFLRHEHVPVRFLRKRRRMRATSSPSPPARSPAPGADPGAAALCSIDGGDALVVDVDGSVCGCPLLAFSYRTPRGPLANRVRSLALGDFRAVSFARRYRGFPEALRRSEIFHHRERKHSRYGRCSDCRYRSSCGVCPLSTTTIAGNADPHRVPDFACAVQQVTGKYRDRFP